MDLQSLVRGAQLTDPNVQLGQLAERIQARFPNVNVAPDRLEALRKRAMIALVQPEPSVAAAPMESAASAPSATPKNTVEASSAPRTTATPTTTPLLSTPTSLPSTTAALPPYAMLTPVPLPATTPPEQTRPSAQGSSSNGHASADLTAFIGDRSPAAPWAWPLRESPLVATLRAIRHAFPDMAVVDAWMEVKRIPDSGWDTIELREIQRLWPLVLSAAASAPAAPVVSARAVPVAPVSSASGPSALTGNQPALLTQPAAAAKPAQPLTKPTNPASAAQLPSAASSEGKPSKVTPTDEELVASLKQLTLGQTIRSASDLILSGAQAKRVFEGLGRAGGPVAFVAATSGDDDESEPTTVNAAAAAAPTSAPTQPLLHKKKVKTIIREMLQGSPQLASSTAQQLREAIETAHPELRFNGSAFDQAYRELQPFIMSLRPPTKVPAPAAVNATPLSTAAPALSSQPAMTHERIVATIPLDMEPPAATTIIPTLPAPKSAYVASASSSLPSKTEGDLAMQKSRAEAISLVQRNLAVVGQVHVKKSFWYVTVDHAETQKLLGDKRSRFSNQTFQLFKPKHRKQAMDQDLVIISPSRQSNDSETTAKGAKVVHILKVAPRPTDALGTVLAPREGDDATTVLIRVHDDKYPCVRVPAAEVGTATKVLVDLNALVWPEDSLYPMGHAVPASAASTPVPLSSAPAQESPAVVSAEPAANSARSSPSKSPAKLVPSQPAASASPATAPMSTQADRKIAPTPSSNSRPYYREYWSDEQINKAIEKKQIVKGSLRVNARNASQSFCQVVGRTQDIFIDGLAARNRALDGDVVYVKILPPRSRKSSENTPSKSTSSASTPRQPSRSTSTTPKHTPAAASDSDGWEDVTDASDTSEVEVDDSRAVKNRKPATASLARPRAGRDGSQAMEAATDESDNDSDVNNHHDDGDDDVSDLDDGEAQPMAATIELAKAEQNELLLSGGSPQSQDRGVVVKVVRQRQRVVLAGRFETAADKNAQSGRRGARAAKQPATESEWLTFRPKTTRVPPLRVPRSQVDEKQIEGMLYLVELVAWTVDSMLPTGKVERVLGKVGDVECETTGILYEHEVNFDEFSPAVLACLPPTPWTLPQDEIAQRRDVRTKRVFSIDPPTARDLDDALHIERLADGKWEVGVHIADVSFFVPEGSALDIEAKARATTVYVVQRAIPMLPRLLCEELCSLNAGVDRCAFSSIFKMDDTGNVEDVWFGRTVMRSCARLTYDHAQHVIEGKLLGDLDVTVYDGVTKAQVADDIMNLHGLAMQMRQRRFEQGVLALHKAKLSFHIDKESGMPTSCSLYQLKESNRLVEEFMLLANMAVAKRIYDSHPENALLRRHPPPDPRGVQMLVAKAKALDLTLDTTSSRTMQDSLNAVADPYKRSVLQQLATVPMRPAEYFCTSDHDEANFRHYALAVPFYTHFTSPIRRYADVIVHRALLSAVQKETRPQAPLYTFALPPMDVSNIAQNCNHKKQMAKKAQEASADLFLCVFLSRNGAVEQEAAVVDIRQSDVRLLIPAFALETVLPFASISAKANVAGNALTLYWGERSAENTAGATSKQNVTQLIHVFDKVRVRLSSRLDQSPVRLTVTLCAPA